MHAPADAFAQTSLYIRICGFGFLFVVAYNVLGGIFRGLGDSQTPLFTVAMACVVNIFGDLILVKGFGLGAAGAALATIFAQAISVAVSLLMIRKKDLLFNSSLKGLLKLTKKSELQSEIDRINKRIDLLKVGLSGIAKRYGYQTVQDFYRFYHTAKNAYADYQEKAAKREKTYGTQAKSNTVRDRIQSY